MDKLAHASALNLIADERRRQDDLIAAGRIPWDCANPSVSDEAKLPVLMEEVGEVARELLEGDPARRLKLRTELIQVAAVATAWAESLHHEAEEEAEMLEAIR